MTVSHQIEEPYLIITLKGEGKFNQETLDQFNQALALVEHNENIHCVVITGENKNFSQGLDLEYIMQLEKNSMEFVENCMKAVGKLLLMPVPVVSAVNGHAFGLGAMITLASDYAVMREDKGFFCLPEIDIRSNLTKSMNALVTFKLNGKVLRDLLLTGKRVGGLEAEQLKIVDLSTTEEKLIETAKLLAQPMMGKDRKVLAQLKYGIHKAILPENFH